MASRFSERPSGLRVPWSQGLPPSVFLGPLAMGEVQGTETGPGLPDQSLKCQTHLGATEFSHVSATFARVLQMTALRPSRCVPGGLYTDGAGQKVTGRLRSGWAGPKRRDSTALPTLRSAAGLVKWCAVDTNLEYSAGVLGQE